MRLIDFRCLSKGVAHAFETIFIDPKKIEKMHQQVAASREQLFGAILAV